MIEEALKEERARLQREAKYNAAVNYIGPEKVKWLRYPLWFPFGRHLNWPAFRHDRNYEKEDRTTKNNWQMAEDFGLELIMSDYNIFKPGYILVMLAFFLMVFPLITIIGRFIDKE